MTDLSKIPQETLIARGKYSTIRAEHEDAKKQLSIHCGELAATASKVLRAMQPDNEAQPESVDVLLAVARATLDLMEVCCDRIELLSAQRAELRPLAWGKK